MGIIKLDVFPYDELLTQLNAHGMRASVNSTVTILIKFLIIIPGTILSGALLPVRTKTRAWIDWFMDHERRRLGHVLFRGCYRTFRTAEREFSDKVQMRS